MPLINIRLAQRDQPTTREQKAALISGVTQLMQTVLNKRAESVVVIIDEVDPDNWGEGGEPVTLRRKNAASSKEIVDK
jgi:4-oxalocrotonate tautomerase